MLPISRFASKFNLHPHLLAKKLTYARDYGAIIRNYVGEAVQAEPMKPTLKAPGTKCLYPKCG